MDNRERLLATLRFERTDRVALLGGWILADQQYHAIVDIPEEGYWNDPARFDSTEKRRVLRVVGTLVS